MAHSDYGFRFLGTATRDERLQLMSLGDYSFTPHQERIGPLVVKRIYSRHFRTNTVALLEVISVMDPMMERWLDVLLARWPVDDGGAPFALTRRIRSRRRRAHPEGNWEPADRTEVEAPSAARRDRSLP